MRRPEIYVITELEVLEVRYVTPEMLVTSEVSVGGQEQLQGLKVVVVFVVLVVVDTG